jgi:hypothetical protein
MNPPALSILITSLAERLQPHLIPLWAKLTAQSEAAGAAGRVELVALLDNRIRTIGEKRDDLLRLARGDYIAYCDDDDDVAANYVSALLAAIAASPGVDVITFQQRAIVDGIEGLCVFGLGQPNEPFYAGRFRRAAWHVCAWRRALALTSQFPATNQGEDWAWAAPLNAAAQSSHHIPEPLHIYRYDPAVSAATPGHRPASAFSWRDIPGWFDFQDVYLHAVATAPENAVFVEGGCWMGRSTAFMLTAIAASGKKISFATYDTFQGSANEPEHRALIAAHGGSLLATARANLARACGPAAADILHECDFAEAAARYADQSVDFCFIDCEHTAAAVRRDILAWLPKMKPGGLLAGHDIDCSAVHESVTAVLGPIYHLHQAGRSWLCQIPQNDIGGL